MAMGTKARVFFLCLLSFALIALTVASDGYSQPPADDDIPIYLGAQKCQSCHGKTGPTAYEKSTNFLRMDEFDIWDKNDLHKRAFEALSSNLGKQMGVILGRGNKDYDVTKDTRCLVCHAVDTAVDKFAQPGQPRQPAKPFEKKTAKDFLTNSGVGCESCHGIATIWFGAHQDASYRRLTPEQKENVDMWDMRNPQRRAERCVSCHVGNEKDGRFVTHEMYAAGHPPLPSIEVMSFSRDQKMHYKLPKDLPYLKKLAETDPEKSWKLFHFRGEEADSHAARQLAVGAVMSLRANAKLLADKANGIDPSKDALDLAHFDCYACHHDLQSDSWRRTRGFVGVPGRPQIRPGVALLAKIVAAHAADATNADAQSPLRQFPEAFKAITAAFDARPFGVPADVAKAANTVVAWCDEVLKKLEDVRYKPAETAKLLKLFVDAGQKPPAGKTNPYLDADAAQQLVWAVETLRLELEAADGPIGQALGKLKDKLPQKVRDTENNNLIEGQLDARFKRQYSFTPQDLHDVFLKLQELVK